MINSISTLQTVLILGYSVVFVLLTINYVMRIKNFRKLKWRNILLYFFLIAMVLIVLKKRLFLNYDPDTHFIDLQVYIDAAERLFLNKGLYNHEEGYLPYTYPPIASFFFIPFIFIESEWAAVLMTMFSLILMVRVVYLLLSIIGFKDLRLIFLLSFLMLLLEPVTETFGFGQVNLILLWLIVEDILGNSLFLKRGILTGIASAIKLTPLIFIFSFVIGNKIRTAVMASLAFVICGLIGIIIVRDDSFLFWSNLIFDPKRVGGVAYATNQSVNGLLWRLLGEGGSLYIWAIIGVLNGAICTLISRSLIQKDDKLGFLSFTALAMLLISPISWSHHWVWALPMLFWLYKEAAKNKAFYIFLLSGITIFCSYIFDQVPKGNDLEYGVSFTTKLITNSYVIWAELLILFKATILFRREIFFKLSYGEK